MGSILTFNRQATIEQLWLNYFNDTLYAKGLITEDERNKMRIKISGCTENFNRALSIDRNSQTKSRKAVGGDPNRFSTQKEQKMAKNMLIIGKNSSIV